MLAMKSSSSSLSVESVSSELRENVSSVAHAPFHLPVLIKL